MARVLIPSPAKRAFTRRLAERLGVDPEHLGPLDGFTIEGGSGGTEAVITWTGHAHLPSEEVLAMISEAGLEPTHYHSTPPGRPDQPCTRRHR